MLKTHQFKTHCKGDIHSSKTANIILPGLMIKQRWTSLRLQAKWYSNSLNCRLKQLISPKLNSLSLLHFTFAKTIPRRTRDLPWVQSVTLCCGRHFQQPSAASRLSSAT